MPAVNQCDMSLKNHDDATIAYCQSHNITYEAFYAMKGCDFKSPVIQTIASSHSVGVAQVCLRWVLQKGCLIAVRPGARALTAPKRKLYRVGPNCEAWPNSLTENPH